MTEVRRFYLTPAGTWAHDDDDDDDEGNEIMNTAICSFPYLFLLNGGARGGWMSMWEEGIPVVLRW